MIKQILLISLAAIMFVGVWVIVLFQFNNQQEPISLDFTTGNKTTNERVIEFPDSIKGLAEKEGNLKSDVESNPKPNSEANEEKVNKMFIDLRDYDFSDVSSVDGIPIDAILEKIKLE